MQLQRSYEGWVVELLGFGWPLAFEVLIGRK
jgi:hypothetical protein